MRVSTTLDKMRIKTKVPLSALTTMNIDFFGSFQLRKLWATLPVIIVVEKFSRRYMRHVLMQSLPMPLWKIKSVAKRL